jgi:hypothetical protein
MPIEGTIPRFSEGTNNAFAEQANVVRFAPLATGERTFRIGSFVPVAAIATIRPTDVTEYQPTTAALFRLDVRELHHLGPLLGFG